MMMMMKMMKKKKEEEEEDDDEKEEEQEEGEEDVEIVKEQLQTKMPTVNVQLQEGNGMAVKENHVIDLT